MFYEFTRNVGLSLYEPSCLSGPDNSTHLTAVFTQSKKHSEKPINKQYEELLEKLKSLVSGKIKGLFNNVPERLGPSM